MTVLRLNILKNTFFIKSLIVATLFSAVSFTGVAMAQGTITVTPNTNLVNGQKVTVSASGLKPNSEGAIVECNGLDAQPEVQIIPGDSAPVSCSSPFSHTIETSKTGTIPATSFTVVTGVVGPPIAGTDTNHVSAATDAALFPCPPTAAQIAAGDFCTISFGDQANDQVSQNIVFSGQASASSTTTTSTATTPSSSTKTTTTPSAASASKLVDTGPGNVVGFFVVIAVVSSLGYFFFRRNTTS